MATRIVCLGNTTLDKVWPVYQSVVDTTGAGYVFHDAYALAIGEGAYVSDAMRYASAVAAVKCTRHGERAGMAMRAEINVFLEKAS